MIHNKNGKRLFRHHSPTKHLKELKFAPINVKKRLSTCRRVFKSATIQRISSVFKSGRDGGQEVKLIRDRLLKNHGFIWRSWSWNESDGACDRVIWNESGAVLGTASSGSETCHKNTEILMIRVQTAPNKNQTSRNDTRGWWTNLLLMRGGLLRHMGGGGGILRGGESLRGGGRTRWVSTAEAVISWPSI